MPTELKGGLLKLNKLIVPTSAVQPGQPVTVRAEVQNTAATVLNVDDADACGADATACDPDWSLGNGYCTQVRFTAEWLGTRVDGPRCVGDLSSEISTNNSVRVYEQTVIMPSAEGDYGLNAEMYLDGSGVVSDPLSRQITVSADAPEEPEYPDYEKTDPSSDVDSALNKGVLIIGGLFGIRALGFLEGD